MFITGLAQKPFSRFSTLIPCTGWGFVITICFFSSGPEVAWKSHSSQLNCISMFMQYISKLLDGILVEETRWCDKCDQKIPREGVFYNCKSNSKYDLCQPCYVKGGHLENVFQLAMYEPGM